MPAQCGETERRSIAKSKNLLMGLRRPLCPSYFRLAFRTELKAQLNYQAIIQLGSIKYDLCHSVDVSWVRERHLDQYENMKILLIHYEVIL